jgi:hypothetical protein
MAGLILRRAVPADGPALEELVSAAPMGGAIRIGVCRGGDFFAGVRVQADEPEVWGAFEEGGRVVGVFSAGRRRVWLEREQSVRVLGDLRIHPEYRRGTLLARGFRLLREQVFAPGEWAQTLVLESNRQALKLLTSGRGGLPEYRAAGSYSSWLLPGQRVSGGDGIDVVRATQKDTPFMENLLGAAARRRSFSHLVDLRGLGGAAWPDLRIEDFLVARRGGEVVGMMGLWDQSRFHEWRVAGYGRAMVLVRPFWNGWAGLTGGLALPPAGGRLRMRKATAVACGGDDPTILRALLRRALGEVDCAPLLLGMSARDPLAAAVTGLRGRLERGRHFLVGWEGKPPEWREPFAFDAARI